MINSKSLFSRSEISPRLAIQALRRDAVFIWNVAVTGLFVCFAALAIAAALLDLISIRH